MSIITNANIPNLIYSNIQQLNNSRFFAGIVMLMLNVGSKYVTINVSKTQEQYLKNNFARQMLIFAVCWMGTRDIVTSLILTASFIIMSDYLLNESSSLCVLPKSWCAFEKELDFNGDGKVSEDEVQKAIKILQKAKERDHKRDQLRMINSLQ